jgi:hypothetical protein
MAATAAWPWLARQAGRTPKWGKGFAFVRSLRHRWLGEVRQTGIFRDPARHDQPMAGRSIRALLS